MCERSMPRLFGVATFVDVASFHGQKKRLIGDPPQVFSWLRTSIFPLTWQYIGGKFPNISKYWLSMLVFFMNSSYPYDCWVHIPIFPMIKAEFKLRWPGSQSLALHNSKSRWICWRWADCGGLLWICLLAQPKGRVSRILPWSTARKSSKPLINC